MKNLDDLLLRKRTFLMTDKMDRWIVMEAGRREISASQFLRYVISQAMRGDIPL